MRPIDKSRYQGNQITYAPLRYEEGGFVLVDPELDETLKPQAQALIDLVKLNRLHGRDGYSGNDDLWRKRKQEWQTAQRYLKKYRDYQSVDLETLAELVKRSGFWSVWMQVFAAEDDVKKELIAVFPGTKP
ncbi:MAG: hypothetical protein Q9O24_07600 [Gammaproteobacteria bacterium]|nr:hypothetical protein [Gammaproteobacteria bacterium]